VVEAVDNASYFIGGGKRKLAEMKRLDEDGESRGKTSLEGDAE